MKFRARNRDREDRLFLAKRALRQQHSDEQIVALSKGNEKQTAAPPSREQQAVAPPPESQKTIEMQTAAPLYSEKQAIAPSLSTRSRPPLRCTASSRPSLRQSLFKEAHFTEVHLIIEADFEQTKALRAR